MKDHAESLVGATLVQTTTRHTIPAQCKSVLRKPLDVVVNWRIPANRTA